MKRMLVFLLVLVCLQVAAQRTFVYLGSYNWDAQKEGMAVYEMDTTDGRLTKLHGFTGVRNPSFITLSPAPQMVYAAADSKTPDSGTVRNFTIDPLSGTFITLFKQPSGGENPVYLSVHRSGRWLVNANYTGGSITVYPTNGMGDLHPAVQVITYTGSSVNKERQERPHPHCIIYSPDGRYVLLADLGTDQILCYPFNAAQSKPLQEARVSAVKAVAGSGPRHLCFHHNGKFVYCIEELSGYVSVYSFKAGALKRVQRIAAHSDSIKNGFESADIHVSPDGRFLYASNRGKENNIAIFSIQPSGHLKFMGCEPTGGNHPRTFAIDPAGKFLVVTNVVSNSVTVLKRNAKTGMLSHTGQQISMPNVSCVQIRAY